MITFIKLMWLLKNYGKQKNQKQEQHIYLNYF
jgi:hypothetical protein